MKQYTFADIQARPYPKIKDINDPNIYGRVGVVINVSKKPYPDEIKQAFAQYKNIKFWHIPLTEKGDDMGLESILRCVSILEEADKNGIPAIVHCGIGINRSRLVAECYHYRKMGFQLEDRYHGAFNHLAYNSSIGLLPPLDEVEARLDYVVSAIWDGSPH
jgi:protein-tyrosine phosphatase